MQWPKKTCKRCIDIILNDDNMFCIFCGQKERHFFKEDPTAKMPFTSKDNYSRISIIWLEWSMHTSRQKDKNPIVITRGQNAKEKRKGEYSIDGNDEQNRTCYEFVDFFSWLYILLSRGDLNQLSTIRSL